MSNNLNADQIRSELEKALQNTANPATHKSLLSEGALQEVKPIENEKTEIILAIKGDRRLQLAVEAAFRTELAKSKLKPDSVKIRFTEPQEQASLFQGNRIPGIKKVIAVASGKGGVGKSTVSVNLAYALAKSGKKTGILDADIYGPSVGKMLGHSGKIDLKISDNKIHPIEKDGVKLMSFSFLIEEGQAVVWRGPMLGKAVKQFLYDIVWGELDYLIIDLPPGTGDTQLSLAQDVTVDGAVIVTTPQNVALLDASRAVDMFNQIKVPVLGVVENMSEFICPNCGQSSHIFSHGGGSRLAEKTSHPLLGQIPLSVAVMESSEKGLPLFSAELKNEEPGFKQALEAYQKVAEKLIEITEK